MYASLLLRELEAVVEVEGAEVEAEVFVDIVAWCDLSTDSYLSLV